MFLAGDRSGLGGGPLPRFKSGGKGRAFVASEQVVGRVFGAPNGGVDAAQGRGTKPVGTGRGSSGGSGSSGAPPPLAGVVQRVRTLPGGRAAVGGLLVAISALGIFQAYGGAGGTPSTSYVVAAHAIAPGTVLRASDLRLQPLALPAPSRARAFSASSVLVGAVTAGPLAAGELVQSSAVVRGGATPYEVSVSLDADRAVDGHLEAGDRVDVVATYGTGSSAYTEAVVRAALVETAPQAHSSVGSRQMTVTLGLTEAGDVLKVVHAMRAGALTLVRSTAARPPAESSADTFQPVPPTTAVAATDTATAGASQP